MRITILEDNIDHQVRLESLLQKLALEANISLRCKVTAKVEEFDVSLEKDRPHHLYFLDLDIQGDREMGFKMAQRVRQTNPYAIIVFVTTLSEYAPETFRYHVSALDFVVKDRPDYEEKVRSCFEYALSQIKTLTQDEDRDLLQYHYRGRLELNIPYDDIFYIETTPSSHKLLVQGRHCRNEFYGALSEIIASDKSENPQLMRVSRSALVNIKNVQSYDRTLGEVVFYDGVTTYPVSRRYVRIVRQRLLDKAR